MKHLRDLVFNAIQSDGIMNSLGIDVDSLYPTYARQDAIYSVEGNRFMILRWGPTEIGIGPVKPVTLDAWMYNREPDYGPITDALSRVRAILAGLVGAPVDAGHSGWVNGVQFQGGTADLFDDVYGAYVRSESHRITASGN